MSSSARSGLCSRASRIASSPLSASMTSVAGLREAVGQGREHQAVVVDDQDRSLVRPRSSSSPAAPPAIGGGRSYAAPPPASRPASARRRSRPRAGRPARCARWRCAAAAARAPGRGRTRRSESVARLKPAGSCARLRDGDAHAVGLGLERAVDAFVAGTVAVRAVLDGVGEQLVQRQRDRDRVALGQDPVGHARPVDPAMDRRGRRSAAPSW